MVFCKRLIPLATYERCPSSSPSTIPRVDRPPLPFVTAQRSATANASSKDQWRTRTSTERLLCDYHPISSLEPSQTLCRPVVLPLLPPPARAGSQLAALRGLDVLRGPAGLHAGRDSTAADQLHSARSIQRVLCHPATEDAVKTEIAIPLLTCVPTPTNWLPSKARTLPITHPVGEKRNSRSIKGNHPRLELSARCRSSLE